MGKIKKITENELVGGTQNTDVYPVTSVKAVYDENNERLDHILNRRGVINISTNYNADHIAEVLTLEQAIAKVPSSDRVLGFKGTYLSTSNEWHDIIYNGSYLSGWTETKNWITVNDNLFVSLSKNATFAGVATPSTVPETFSGPVYYLAIFPGTYTNFDNIEVLPDNGLPQILLWNNVWTLVECAVREHSNSNALYFITGDYAFYGFNEALLNAYYEYGNDGTIIIKQDNQVYVTGFIPVSLGDTFYYSSSNVYYRYFYDTDKNLLYETHESTSEVTISDPKVKYIRFAIYYSSNVRIAKSKEELIPIRDRINNCNSKIDKIDTHINTYITDSTINNTSNIEIPLVIGYFNYITGNYTISNVSLCTKNLIPCLPNTTYTANVEVRQWIFYDENKSIIGYKTKHDGNTYDDVKTIVTPHNVKYIRLNINNQDKSQSYKSCIISGLFNNDEVYRKAYNIINNEDIELVHILLLGQSLSMGYRATPILNAPLSKKALMFKHIRTQDFGYIYGISKDTYNNNQEYYDNDFYSTINTLQEEGDYGTLSTKWESASDGEYETPCSGIVEGLLNKYLEYGYTDLPFKIICTAPGIGGTSISKFYQENSNIVARYKKDIDAAYKLAMDKKLSYKLIIVWIQGENDYGTSIESYKNSLKSVYDGVVSYLNKIGIKDNSVKMYSYQTNCSYSSYYGYKSANPSLAQIEADKEYDWFHLCSSCYNLDYHADKVHLTSIGSRTLGNIIGFNIFYDLNYNFMPLRITKVVKYSNVIKIFFNSNIKRGDINSNGAIAENDKSDINKLCGFFVYNGSGESIGNSISIDKNIITIGCSDTPSYLYYGMKKDVPYIVGGIICKDTVNRGYVNFVNEYLPIQKIASLDSQHDM